MQLWSNCGKPKLLVTAALNEYGHQQSKEIDSRQSNAITINGYLCKVFIPCNRECLQNFVSKQSGLFPSLFRGEGGGVRGWYGQP